MRKTTSRYEKIACIVTLSLGIMVSKLTFSTPITLAQGEDEKLLHVDDSIDLDSDEEVAIIVELEEAPEKVALAKAEVEGEKLTATEARNEVKKSQDEFVDVLDDMANTASEYEIEHTYGAVFNGASLTLPANKIEKLLEYEGIKKVYSNDTVELFQPVAEKDSDNPLEIMDDSVSRLGVTDMHVDGLTGEGVKIGVIDTGIDYNHPDLKNAYQGGYDFVDDDNDPMETTYEDWLKSELPETNVNGRSYYTSHGTHVAGTISGKAENDSEYAVSGVAPDVELYAYRTIGPYGSGSTSDIIASIEQAVLDDVDVINLSLGTNSNDPIYPTSIAVNNATLAGVTVVAAAGNYGLDGLASVGAPATASLSIAVGASDVLGDILADTSSRGPIDVTAAIKPEVVAPGIDILSTVPSYMNGTDDLDDYEFAYNRDSGTSMAAPHVTGVVALMLQADKDLTPAEIKTRLMNTARPLSQNYNVFEVGAGLINPQTAVETDMTIQTTIDGLHVVDDVLEWTPDHTGAISYGMLSTSKGNVRERHSLRLTNRSSEAKTFKVDVKFHAVNGTLSAAGSGVVLKTNQKVTIPSGQTVTNNTFLFAPKTTSTGLYGGYITYTNRADENEVYRVPFGTYITSKVIEPLPIGDVLQ